MARRKTVVAHTGAELSLQEARADAKKDRPRQAASRGLLPTLAEWREARNRMTEYELLKLARSAARLELRGAMYSADDRLDVAATIVADVLAANDGATPRRDSAKYASLGAACKRAQTLRRTIDRTREHDAKEARARAVAYAQSPAALGAEHTPAAHVAILAMASERAAERAASAVCSELGLPADCDSPAWCVFYQWARGATGEVCAAERGVTWACWKVRQSRGAKFVRGFYGAAELMGRLSLGATVDAAGEIVFALRDDSREAHGRTPILAPDWRETQPAETPVRETSLTASEKVHWRRRREHRKDAAEQVADALARLARAYAQSARRERATARKSALPHAA